MFDIAAGRSSFSASSLLKIAIFSIASLEVGPYLTKSFLMSALLDSNLSIVAGSLSNEAKSRFTSRATVEISISRFAI